jgi:hypothetical protein
MTVSATSRSGAVLAMTRSSKLIGVRQLALNDLGDLAGQRRFARSVRAGDQDRERVVEGDHGRSVRSLPWLMR